MPTTRLCEFGIRRRLGHPLWMEMAGSFSPHQDGHGGTPPLDDALRERAEPSAAGAGASLAHVRPKTKEQGNWHCVGTVRTDCVRPGRGINDGKAELGVSNAGGTVLGEMEDPAGLRVTPLYPQASGASRPEKLDGGAIRVQTIGTGLWVQTLYKEGFCTSRLLALLRE